MTHEHRNEMAAAEAARRRAQEALAEVKAQRPEVKEVAKAAIQVRRINGLAEAVVLAVMGGNTRE